METKSFALWFFGQIPGTLILGVFLLGVLALSGCGKDSPDPASITPVKKTCNDSWDPWGTTDSSLPECNGF